MKTLGILAVLAMISVLTVSAGTVSGKVTGIGDPTKVVVWIDGVEGNFEPPSEPVKMDQKNKTFIPFILPVMRGTTVRFVNSDSSSDGTGMAHNVKFLKFGNSRTLVMREKSKNMTNFMVWAGKPKDAKTIRPGKVAIVCNIHTEMEAYVVVLPNPFFAVPAKDGTFEIENVLPGNYTLEGWDPRQDRKKFQQDISVKAHGNSEVIVDFRK